MDDSQLPGAIIFDRDGTLTRSLDPVTEPDDIELLDGAAETIRACNKAGVLVGLASNQGIVSRGLLSIDGLVKVHERLVELLHEQGAVLDGFRYCPHHPRAIDPLDRTCLCRKPGPQMLADLAKDFQVSHDQIVMVGDNITDIEAASNASMKSILVLTGHGETFRTDVAHSQTAKSVREAVARLGIREL
jgi:HAD superfamily hydrolase (TIGR01662 family)